MTPGRLRTNIAANALGTGVTALAGLLAAPLVYRALGPEGYGLVGVYLLLQGLMPLFDLGITPGLARAIAWHRGRGQPGAVPTLIRLAHVPMAVVAAAFVLTMLAAAVPIAEGWLRPQALSTGDVALALVLMSLALSLRLLGALNRAALMAMEMQAKANLAQAVAATARTFGALGVAYATDTGVIGFLVAQIPVSAIEWWWCAHLLRPSMPGQATPVARAELVAHARFALGIAGLAALWLLASQVDRLLLSIMLSLDDYGRYSLAVHVAAIVALGVSAIHAAALPRLTRLFAAGELGRARLLYGLTTALTVATAGALLSGLATAGPIWLPRLAGLDGAGLDPMPVALAYAVGQSGLAVLGLAYLLQSARGRLRLHAMVTILHTTAVVPLVLFLANRGVLPMAIGIALVHWFFVLAWMPIAHRRHLEAGHLRWLQKDLLPSLVAACAMGILLASVGANIHGDWAIAMVSVVGAGMVFAVACAAHAGLRAEALAWSRRRHA